jgi:squalene cyclase
VNAIRPIQRLGHEAALERACTALLARQSEDGSWHGETDLGPIGPATQVIVESLFGKTRRVSWKPLGDGSFPPYPQATHGAIGVTALVMAACEPSSEVARRAQAWIDANGGLSAVGRALHERSDIAALYLVATGHLEASVLPPIPPGLALVPLEHMLDRHVHAGNVMVTMVVAALAARHGPERTGFFGQTRVALEMTRIKQYLTSWQNADGSWNGSPLQTTLMLLGLHAAGMTASDAPIKRALAWLDGMIDCAMENDVWSTALCTLAIEATKEHVPTRARGEASAAIERGRAYLLDCQTREPMPRANQRKRNARRTGGWPFQRGNTTMPDTDDTGVVLAALGTIAGEVSSREMFRAIDDGIAWLRDMQNADGGFPTFVWGLPSKKPGPMFVSELPMAVDASFLWAPPAELGDPSLEGVTGRVLWGLGRTGITRDDPAVCDAIAFLKRHQCESGAWWGRWKVAFLAETATILIGLQAVGEDMRAPYVERATSWIVSCQNDDGGFGELPAAYRDPRRAGEGPSMPAVTAYALLGLMAADAPRRAIDAAAAYLLATQRADGLWDNEGWLHTFIPPDLLYTYDMPALALPLLALAEYTEQTHR